MKFNGNCPGKGERKNVTVTVKRSSPRPAREVRVGFIDLYGA
jgi:hypothetical protein